MVEVGTGTAKTRFIKTNWPITKGLTAGTTKQTGKKMNLVPEEDSLIPEKDKAGL